jgi:hypothetical protein
MELAACHIFISIDENNYPFPILSPFQELSTNILQENVAWAALDAHMFQLPALLAHYRKIPAASACTARDVDGKEASHVSLTPFKLHPRISSQAAFVNPNLGNSGSQVPESQLERSSILSTGVILVGVVSCYRA